MDNYHNPEAEMILMGSILKRSDIMAEADTMLRPDDFSIKAIEMIFSEMLQMYKQGIGLDPITVASHMKPEELKAIGGLTFLMKAHDAPATLLNYREHIREVKKRSNTRKLAAALSEAIIMVKSEEPEEVIQYLQTQIMESLRQSHTGLATADKIAIEILEGKPEPSIMTGFNTLDRTMRGLKKGRVLTIAGRPGTGKTAFSLRILDQLPVTERAIYFSLEMSRREITERLMASQTYAGCQGSCQ